MTGRKRRAPEPLRLRKHLDACTTKELGEFHRFWSPHGKPPKERTELGEALFRLMSDENVVYAKVDLLSERVRAVLMALLRKLHYASDLQGLLRGIDGLEVEPYEAEAALTALARRGFVRQRRPRDGRRGRATFAIPQETALVMRGLAGTDRRPLRHVFVHETFRPGSVEAGAQTERAAVPEDVEAALADLPDPLRAIAAEVIDRFGGILTRREFADVFADRGLYWSSASFLHEYGRRGLGTVGHLDLRGRGLGVDDDALLFFAEVVERRVAQRRAEPLGHDAVLTAHGDLMSDVVAALTEIDEGTFKVAKEGRVYKSSRGRLAEKLQFPEQPLLDRVEVAQRVLSVARGLGLAETNGDNVLSVTEKGVAWRDRPLLDKVRDAYALLGRDDERTLRARHLRGLRAHVVALLEDGDGWWPGATAGFLARNRYLLQVEDEDLTIEGAQLSSSPAALTELGRAAQEVLTRELFALGLVDVALHDGAAAGVRLSRLGRRVLLDAAAEEPEAMRPLVVNPDFEMLVLPEGDVDDLLHRLDRVAVRVRTGEVVHYRLDRERVERLAVAGEPPDTVVDLLQAYARTELPQNVVYSIRSWGGNVRSATLRRGVVLEAPDPAVVETVRSHPAFRELVLGPLGPHALLLDESVLDRPLAQELKALGIYLR